MKSTEDRAAKKPKYEARRKAVCQRLQNAILLVGANTEPERGNLRTGFFQEPGFLYLTGWTHPGAVLLLGPGTRGHHAEMLFLPDQDEAKVLWTGPAFYASGKPLQIHTDVRTVLPMRELEAALASMLTQNERILTVPGSSLEEKMKAAWPFRTFGSAHDILAKLRMRKSDEEIELIRRAVAITAEGQLRGWRSLQQSRYEYEVVADVTHEFLRRGAERHAFAPIVAGGANACILHYSRNRAPLREGSLAILDVGAENAGYCGDLTRTIPVGGTFRKRHRELYEAVLDVQKAIIRSVKPGAILARDIPGGLHQQAMAMLNECKLGRHDKPLGMFFPHGIGHHLGMEVHDLCEAAAPLEPGMVVTIEPGVYIREEGIGIRIEDDVLVTEDGCEVLSAALPKEAAEIEEILAP